MKKLALLGLTLILIGVVIMREDDIVSFIRAYLIPKQKVELVKGEYFREYDFSFVQNTEDFEPNNKQDIINIFYTALNSGEDSFTFYCPKEYKDCIKEVDNLAKDQEELSDINNYVHPFNSFANIKTIYDSSGKVTITFNKTYTQPEIDVISEKVDELYPTLVSENNDLTTNIRNIHDYIINNTKYDSDRTDNNVINYKSDTAYGPLFQGYAICGGYTDLMEIFLFKMNVKCFKVSSNEHIWNAVYVNDKWLNLDLTWDDPVASDGRNYLEYTYFLVDTNTLQTTETTQHNFNIETYKELQN